MANALQELAITDNVAIGVDSSISKVINTMMDSKCGLVVFEKNNIPIGVITEREVLQLMYKNIPLSSPITEHVHLTTPIAISFQRGCEYALHILIDNGIRRLIILNNDGSFYGVVSQELLVDHLESSVYKTDMLVGNFLKEFRELVCVDEDTSVEDSVKIMFEKNVGSVIIKDKYDIPIGIFTEKDGLKIKSHQVNDNTPIKEVMTSPLITINKNALLQDAVRIMRANSINRILICDENDKPTYIISLREITKSLQGNYEKLLETRLKNLKNSLNYIGEYIFEVHEDKGEFIVQWMNNKAHEKIGDYLDRPVTDIIHEQVWELIYHNLKYSNMVNNYKVKIKDLYFEISCSNHYANDEETLLFVLKDITSSESEIQRVKQENDELNIEVSMLQQIIDTQNNIIFVTDGISIQVCNKTFLSFFNAGDLYDFNSKITSLSKKFIAHPDYFAPSKLTVNWVEEILLLPQKNRVITIVDYETFEPRVFVVNIIPIPTGKKKYLISLEDITHNEFEDNKFYYNATHDTMTQAYNRSYFYDLLEDEIARAKRYNSTFSIIRFNIDNLGELNKEYGYIKGDEVIKQIIDNFNKYIRNTDILARYSNDDFIFLLPETMGNKCELICQNLKTTLEDLDFTINKKITLSYGITQFHVVDNEHTILERTKNALLEAKQNGKNCMVVK